MKWRLWVDETPSMHLPERRLVTQKITQAIDLVWKRNRNEVVRKDNWAWSESPLILISDFIWGVQQWKEFHRARRQQRIIAVHVLYSEEQKWDLPDELIEDCETRERLRIDRNIPEVQQKQSEYWKEVSENLRGVIVGNWVIRRDDLTCLEGVLWN